MNPNVQLAASIEFLKADLACALQSTNEKHTLLVKQLNAGEKATGISFGELAGTLATSVGIKKEDISLPPELEDIAENYKIYIKQVYLKIEVEEGSEEKEFEYALWLSINIDQEGLDKLIEKSPIFGLFAIKEVALKIWNTTNSKVLEEMNFVDIKKQLGLNA
jgi:hypothetical protein